MPAPRTSQLPASVADRVVAMTTRITISAVRGLLRAEELRLAGYQHRRDRANLDGEPDKLPLIGIHEYEITRHIHDLRRLVVGKQPRDNAPREVRETQ